MGQTQRRAWDVLGGEITEADLADKVKRLRSNFLYYQKNPHIWRIRTTVFGVLTVIMGLLVLWLTQAVDAEYTEPVQNIGIFFIVFLAGCFLAMFHMATEMKKNMTKLLIAERNQWLFDPETSAHRLDQLQKQFSFLRRGEDTGIDDQYWGQTDINGKRADFWMALHHYTTGSGKQKTSHTATLMAFRLPRAVERPFYIREGAQSSFFNKADVQLESIEFNKRFVVKHADVQQSDATEILKVLTPATQQQFIEFAKRFGGFGAAFSGNAVMFSIDLDWLDAFNVAPFGKFEIDPRNEKLMHDRMTMMFTFAAEMIRFVD